MKCNQCGTCCKLFLINLTEEEYISKQFKTQFDEFVENFEEAELICANIIEQKEDNSCIYQKNNKCSIHNKRPQSCRNFYCQSKNQQFKVMITQINSFRSKVLKTLL